MSVRLKIFFAWLALIVVSVFAGDAYLTRAVDAKLTETIRHDLIVRTKLAAHHTGLQATSIVGGQSFQAFTRGIGALTESRATVIARDGTVLGDSGVDEHELGRLENHADRPEVIAALAHGEGDSIRFSQTTQQRMMYVAVPFSAAPSIRPRDTDVGRDLSEKTLAGTVRLAVPLSEVDAALREVRGLIAVASIIALGVAVILSFYASERMSRRIAQLTSAASQMASGDLSMRTRMGGNDEVARLGQALDQLATSLSSTLEELRSERDAQSQILQGMQEGLLVLDAANRVVTVNAALRSMLLVPSDSVGKPLLEVIRDASLASIIDRARKKSAAAFGEIELPGLKPRRVLLHATPFGDEHAILAVFVDVTELRRLESLRRDFVANVSHELRTPVAAIRSATETLQRGALSDPASAPKFLQMVQRNSDRLQNLIEDLLDLSRLEAKQFRLAKDDVDIDQLFQIVCGLFREKAEKKGVILSSEPAQGTKRVQSDQRALEQVLSNLVDNAIKYCPSGTHVSLHAVRDGSSIRFHVRDDGPGIAERHLPRLFERFYRVDESRSRELGGTGLGLSIVKHLVEAMGGTVGVESRPGEGTSFSVAIPMASGSAPTPT